jgi:hypothetical protein
LDDKGLNANATLHIVVDFIRGNINLDEAKQKLYALGFDKESAEKVLMETPRENIISMEKTNKN